MEPGPDPDPPPSADDSATGAAPDRPSKTRRKQQMHELQHLGERLVGLDRAMLQRLALPSELLEAVEQAQRTPSREGRRRQLQYVGRVMRGVDPEPIRTALERATGSSRAAVAWMRRCEALRDRLLADDDALTELLRERPGADAQWLRATIRAARRELDDQRPPRHARELYRWLHQHLEPPA